MKWQDEVQQVLVFHTEKQKKLGKGQSGRPRKGKPKPGWSIRDTAKELNLSIGRLCEDLQLGMLLESNPKYQEIKEKKLALAKLKRDKNAPRIS